MSRWLCWLGLHRWVVVTRWFAQPEPTGLLITRLRCSRCGLESLDAYDTDRERRS